MKFSTRPRTWSLVLLVSFAALATVSVPLGGNALAKDDGNRSDNSGSDNSGRGSSNSGRDDRNRDRDRDDDRDRDRDDDWDRDRDDDWDRDRGDNRERDRDRNEDDRSGRGGGVERDGLGFSSGVPRFLKELFNRNRDRDAATAESSHFEMRYSDGYREIVNSGTYLLADPFGNVVIRRQANDADLRRVRGQDR